MVYCHRVTPIRTCQRHLTLLLTNFTIQDVWPRSIFEEHRRGSLATKDKNAVFMDVYNNRWKRRATLLLTACTSNNVEESSNDQVAMKEKKLVHAGILGPR